MAGYSKYIDGVSEDAMLIKTNANGEVTWSKVYENFGYDYIYCVQQTNDGGYIFVGYYHNPPNSSDMGVFKTDAAGTLQWSNAYKGSATTRDVAYAIEQTSDGGYIILGSSDSTMTGNRHMFLVKVNASGNLEWNKIYGYKEVEFGNAIRQTNDGGYIIVGGSFDFSLLDYNILLVKTDNSGNVMWSKTFGSASIDVANSVILTADGGYLIGGQYNSDDCLLIKTDAAGSVEWAKTYGSANNDEAFDVLQKSDGGFVMVGVSHQLQPTTRAYIISTNDSGDVSWAKHYMLDDCGTYSVQQTADLGYVLFGETDLSGGLGTVAYMVKIDSSGSVGCNISLAGSYTEVADITLIESSPTMTVLSGGIAVPITPIAQDLPLVTDTYCVFVGMEPKLLSNKAIELYPNPSNGVFTLELTVETTEMEKVTIKFVNLLGVEAEVISNEELSAGKNTFEIDVQDYPAGIYFLQLKTEEGMVNKKIILQ